MPVIIGKITETSIRIALLKWFYDHGMLIEYDWHGAYEKVAEKYGLEWRELKLIDSVGHKISNIQAPYPIAVELPVYVIVWDAYTPDFEFRYLRDLSTREIVRGLMGDAFKTWKLAETYTQLLGIPVTGRAFALFSERFHVPMERISTFLQGTLEYYQRTAGWVGKTIHIDLLERVHRILRVGDSRYNDFVRRQEKSLGVMSGKIFGNTGQLQGYVHLMELILYDAAIRAGKTNDEAQKRSLQHGAELCNHINRKLYSYERHPEMLWRDLYVITFGIANEYIQITESADISALAKTLGKVAGDLETLRDRLDRVGLYNKAFEEIGVGTVEDGIAGLFVLIRDYYDDNLKDVINRIELEVTDHLRKISDLEKRREAERLTRVRSHLLSADSESLNPSAREIQHDIRMQVVVDGTPNLTDLPVGKRFDIDDIFSFGEDDYER